MQQIRGDSGLWLSPQPLLPQVIGQRRLESTLFDLRQMDIARRLARGEARQLEATRGAPGSGLIDIASLVGAVRGDAAYDRKVVVPPPRGLVPQARVVLPPPVAAVPRRLLVALCLLMLAAVAMLWVAVLA
jgi:hypothetical protein